MLQATWIQCFAVLSHHGIAEEVMNKTMKRLKLSIAAIGLTACVTCHAQNGLMLTAVANFYGTNGSEPSFFPRWFKETTACFTGQP